VGGIDGNLSRPHPVGQRTFSDSIEGKGAKEGGKKRPWTGGRSDGCWAGGVEENGRGPVKEYYR